MVETSPRVRGWLYFALVVAAAVIAILIYVRHLDRKANLEFDTLAAMKYETALAEVKKNIDQHGGKLNKRLIYLCTDNLQPGQAIGYSPRFLNIGKTPVIIFNRKIEEGKGHIEFYVLGKVLVREYVGKRWREVTTVENEYFSYNEPAEE